MHERKKTKGLHKKVKEIRTTRPLNLLHMDLMGPMRIESKGGQLYVLMVVDDFSRYFVSFLREKSEAIQHLKFLFNRIQVEIGHPIVRIRSDRGREFDNVEVDLFFYSKGIKHEYSTPRTPQPNKVVERRNKVLQEMTRVKIHIQNTPKKNMGIALIPLK